MALSGIIKHSFDTGSLKLADGTATPLEHTARFDQADFQLSNYVPGGREAVPYQTRGTLRSVRGGQRVFPTISITMAATDFTEATTGTMHDFLLATSGTPYASRVSVDTTLSELFLHDVTFTQEGTEYGDGADATITLSKCFCTGLQFSEGEPNTITYEATVYGDVTFG